MKEVMILIAIIISYPIFMAFSYIVARYMFPSLDKVEAAQEQEKLALMLKARRVRRIEKHAVPEPRVEKEIEPRFIHA